MEGAIPRGEVIRFVVDVNFQHSHILAATVSLSCTPSQGLSEPYPAMAACSFPKLPVHVLEGGTP